MGSSLNTYVGIYVELSDIYDHAIKTHYSLECPDHGPKKGKYCDECGKEIQKVAQGSLSEKTLKPLLGPNEEYEDYLIHTNMECNGTIVGIPNFFHSGQIEIDFEYGSTYQFNEKDHKECLSAFNEKYVDYINYLIQLKVTFNIKFGVVIYWN